MGIFALVGQSALMSVLRESSRTGWGIQILLKWLQEKLAGGGAMFNVICVRLTHRRQKTSL